ncbi:PTS lactose/cellobiose transporter subunit IIA [Oceanobacillus arenosus]|uniref:PTS lactose/cellobiose transporter subunit IIA n=1 Tax=Oceanobacillus arenosus TaxID=1229153 RepID=A0A3D8Q1P9_9BACI|nr:PTS lactose/cellobiose transporter subunit IIA [Oceanobacillus arenosus]RDW21491.1 PTS lactose/cellobiose transporter subunit IIA [Oceanobacillus arenosus]
MGLILHSGNAKSYGMEGIQAAKQGDMEAADRKMEAANNELENAHNAQTNLLSKEASGENVEVTLLMVHAQDHLMNAMTFCDLANEFIELYKSK